MHEERHEETGKKVCRKKPISCMENYMSLEGVFVSSGFGGFCR